MDALLVTAFGVTAAVALVLVYAIGLVILWICWTKAWRDRSLGRWVILGIWFALYVFPYGLIPVNAFRSIGEQWEPQALVFWIVALSFAPGFAVVANHFQGGMGQ